MFLTMFFISNVAFAHTHTLPTFTPDEAMKVLSDPKAFSIAYQNLSDKPDNPFGEKHLSKHLFDLAPDNQTFLRSIPLNYIFDENEWIVGNEAIRRMKFTDDQYFKLLFEASLYMRNEALLKISDMAYVKMVITKEASKYSSDFNSPGVYYLNTMGEHMYRTDKDFVDKLIESATNPFVRIASIKATSNRVILEKFVNTKHVVIWKENGIAETDSYFNVVFREVAIKRLNELID